MRGFLWNLDNIKKKKKVIGVYEKTLILCGGVSCTLDLFFFFLVTLDFFLVVYSWMYSWGRFLETWSWCLCKHWIHDRAFARGVEGLEEQPLPQDGWDHRKCGQVLGRRLCGKYIHERWWWWWWCFFFSTSNNTNSLVLLSDLDL